MSSPTPTPAPHRELLRFVTAGGVDDGKSTLIGRLLTDSGQVYEDHLTALREDSARLGAAGGVTDFALLTDGLKAEREQGITIDVAYRYFATPKRKFIIADCPGHTQYTRNMATGASTANLAVLLIDAQTGLIEQTRRHAGSVASGILRRDQAIFALPSGQKAKVARISTFDGDRDEAFPPQAVTVCLDRDLDVGRGEMLVQPRNLPRVGRAIEAMVIWMHPTPLVLGRRIAVKHLTRWVNATVVAVRHRIDLATIHRQDATTLGENEIGRVALELTEDIAFDPYARNRATGALILVDPDDNATLGAALILERGLTRKSLYGDNRKSLYGDNHDTNAARSDDATSGNTDRISPSERQTRLGQRPCTLWIEGATAADIITLARRLERRLFDAGRIAVFIDPSTAPEAPHTEGDADARHHHDATRLHLAKQARMLNDAGLIAIVAMPLTGGGDPAESSMRKRVAAIVGKDRLVPLRVDVDPGSKTDIEANLSAGSSNPVPKQDATSIDRWTTLALAHTRLGDSDET